MNHEWETGVKNQSRISYDFLPVEALLSPVVIHVPIVPIRITQPGEHTVSDLLQNVVLS